jgi:ribonuclease HII|tara:strand:- start:19167 stop:19757 length:591 start_codon:yes stop_codon:yes gene_type:complete
MKPISKIEIDLTSKGKKIVGIDEVGRGSLVGPVVACAFMLDSLDEKININDSKKLSENSRAYSFTQLMVSGSIFGLGYSSHDEIDKINILNATKLAMIRAIENLRIIPDVLLIDGNEPLNTEIEEICIVKGDLNCTSIGAASIIAKVTRDFILKKISRIFPHYNLERNKGYGTLEHLKLIKKYGPSPFHRKSFKIK